MNYNSPKSRNNLKRRIKIICQKNQITRIDLVKQNYGGIIPKAKSWKIRYAHINNMLNPNGMCKVEDWLVALIKEVEKTGYEIKNKKVTKKAKRHAKRRRNYERNNDKIITME
jgi:hypothetical protein